MDGLGMNGDRVYHKKLFVVQGYRLFFTRRHVPSKNDKTDNS